MDIKESVKAYYGSVLQSSDDLATDACCTLEETPPAIAAAIANVHPEVAQRYYGCGLVVPQGLAGARVLDLGSGAGRDAYVLAQLVGEAGSVIGVDMTPAQLAVARAHVDWHANRFGYANSNVTFLEGDIERLLDLNLAPESVDVIVSNCVINLCADKRAVFDAAHALLKPGGEMYFADVYADTCVPSEAKNDPRAHGECLAGALYWKDFIDMAIASGFDDPRLVAHRPLTVRDDGLRALLGNAAFQSATYRLVKTSGATAEPAGAYLATYDGSLPDADGTFILDEDNAFPTGGKVTVSSETAQLLRESRFSNCFAVEKSDVEETLQTPNRSPFKPTKSAPCCG
ncbi:MAG: methyltransferase domain-containing protein [Pseudomonadota bacterium]